MKELRKLQKIAEKQQKKNDKLITVTIGCA